jgi:hypothetical protein
MENMILPKTVLGWWSVCLIATMPLLFYAGMSAVDGLYEGVQAGSSIPQDVVTRPGVALSMLAGFGCGITAFITGLTAIIKHKERAIPVYLSTLLGLCTILWLTAEIAWPH